MFRVRSDIALSAALMFVLALRLLPALCPMIQEGFSIAVTSISGLIIYTTAFDRNRHNTRLLPSAIRIVDGVMFWRSARRLEHSSTGER